MPLRLPRPPLRHLSTTEPSPPRLSRPLGFPHPPHPGENTGLDPRTWAERRADFTNYDKHLAARAQMTREFQTSYWRDFHQLSAHYKGKSFLAPSTLLRSSTALYFPNLSGLTLSGVPRADTTPVLRGRVSVVSVFSSAWAEGQVRSFTDGLGVEEEGGAQRVDVNVEMNWVKAGIVRLFMGRIRKRYEREMWGRYFLVRRGVTEEVREGMGYGNGKVGYVYLVDWECKIRWAGSGHAEEGEREALRRGVGRLVGEWRGLVKEGRQEVKEGGQKGKEGRQEGKEEGKEEGKKLDDEI